MKSLYTWAESLLASLVVIIVLLNINNILPYLQSTITPEVSASFEKVEGAEDRFSGVLEKNPDTDYDYKIKGTNINIISKFEDIEGKYIKILVRYTGVGDNFKIISRNISDSTDYDNKYISSQNTYYKFEGVMDINGADGTEYEVFNQDGYKTKIKVNGDLYQRINGKRVKMELKITEL